MKILNAYCGIGGNRKLWGNDHDITAVELDPKIAEIYKDFFPKDNIIVTDAHQYLLDHYKEFDFIWSSPPCPTHSDIRRCGVHSGQVEAIYPDMRLYQEIILLQHFAPRNCQWVIENVKPYYEPLIEGKQLHRHLFWTNFDITFVDIPDKRIHSEITVNKPVYGFDIKKYNHPDKRKLLRNMVNPELGLYMFNQAFNKKTEIIKQSSLF